MHTGSVPSTRPSSPFTRDASTTRPPSADRMPGEAASPAVPQGLPPPRPTGHETAPPTRVGAARLPGPTATQAPGAASPVTAGTPLPEPQDYRSATQRAAAVNWAQTIAQQHDFAKELALAGDNYATLEQGVADVSRAANILRGEWAATGEGGHLRAAQRLELKLALLKGLLGTRRANRDWFEQAAGANPAGLPEVLAPFRQALFLCENQPGILEFPTQDLGRALAPVRELVAQSRQCLADGSWPATKEGQWHAECQQALHASTASTPVSGPAPQDALAGLKTACQELGEVLDRLQTALLGAARDPDPHAAVSTAPSPGDAPDRAAPQPAPDRARPAPTLVMPRSFKAVLAGGPSAPVRPTVTPRHAPASITPPAAARAPARRPEDREPPRTGPRATATASPPGGHPRGYAARHRPGAWGPGGRGSAMATAHEPPTARPAQRGPNSRTPGTAATAAAPPTAAAVPVAPASTPIEAAVPTPTTDATAPLRQELLAPFQAERARLQAAMERLADPTRPALAGEPGQRGSALLTEFLDWQQLALEGRQCDDRLTAQAEAVLGPDHRDAAVGRLRREIAHIGQRAQAQATQSAEAFARTCHQAAPEGPLHAAPASAFVSLADRASRLRQQWDAQLVRPDETERQARNKQYVLFESLCSVLGAHPQTAQQALDDAERLRQAMARAQPGRSGRRGAVAGSLAAWHASCHELRSRRLREAAGLAAAAVRALQLELQGALEPVQRRCMEVPAACAALLIGHPVPDPGAQAGNWQANAQDLSADLCLVQQAQDAATRARALCEMVEKLALPDDAPPPAHQALQVARLAGRQLGRSATLGADLLGGLHELGNRLGSTPRAQRAALLRPYVRNLEAHRAGVDGDLVEAGRRRSGKAALPGVPDLVQHCAAALAADRRLVQVNLAALQTLERLLAARHTADQTIPELEVGVQSIDPSAAQLVTRGTHAEMLIALESSMASLSDEPAPPARAPQQASPLGEPARLDRSVQALRLAIQRDDVLIQSKIECRLAAQGPIGGASDRDPKSRLTLIRNRAATLAREIEQNSKSIASLIPKAPHGRQYEVQIQVNNEVRDRLLAMMVDLSRQLKAFS